MNVEDTENQNSVFAESQKQIPSSLNVGPLGGEFYADLTIGHDPVLQFASLSDLMRLRVRTPDGNTNETILAAGVNIYTEPLPVLTAGRYYYGLLPVHTNTVTFHMSYNNADREILRDLTSGMVVSVSLPVNWEYAKYRINLNANQLLSLPGPANSNIKFTVLSSASEQMSAFTGLPLNFIAPATGTYHLFIDHVTGAAGAAYTGTATISN